MNRYLTPELLAVALHAALLSGQSAADGRTEGDLLTIVESDTASQHDRAVAFLQLASVGSDQSVPMLKPLLKDPKLSHYARYALQNIPGEAAGRALRDALNDLKGDRLVGVINSLAARGDKQSTPQLEELAKSSRERIALAAAAALVDIDPHKAESLLMSVDSETRLRLADAVLDCAARLADEGETKAAAELLESLDRDDVPSEVRTAVQLATLRQLEGEAATSLVRSMLASEEDWRFTAGLQAAVNGHLRNGADVLVTAIDQTQPPRQARLLNALRALGDRSAAEAVRQAVMSDSPAVRIAAINALGTLGDASDAPLLIRLALENNEFSAAARESLAEIDDDQIDAVIIGMLKESTGSEQALVARLVGQRRIIEGAASLVQVSKEADDAETRRAALEAAGQLAVGHTLPDLLMLAIEPKSKSEGALAKKACLAAASRVSDLAAATDAVAELLESGEQVGFMLDVLARIGGTRSLELVAATALKADRASQDQASRVLGDWPTADAAPALRQMAESDSPFAIRALRGYIRIARQLAASDSERAAMCRTALSIAKREQERLLVLEVLERAGSAEALEIATSELSADRLGVKASESVIEIARQVAPTSPGAAASAAKQVLQTGGSRAVLEAAAELARR